MSVDKSTWYLYNQLVPLNPQNYSGTKLHLLHPRDAVNVQSK